MFGLSETLNSSGHLKINGFRTMDSIQALRRIHSRNILCAALGSILIAAPCITIVGCKNMGTNPEAKAEAQKLVDKFYTKCGDSYYMWVDSNRLSLRQLKGDIHITIESGDLSDVDHMNGYEWRGVATLRCPAQRDWAGSWWPWQADCGYSFPLSKRNATWMYEPASPFAHPQPIDSINPPNISCEKLPK
jgi:hypothetical protein